MPNPIDPDVGHPFDAQKEYRKLLEEIEYQKKTRKQIKREIQNDDVTSLEVYQKLMQKEDNVLKTINRVVNDASVRQYNDLLLSRDLANMTISNIILRTVGSVHQLFEDLIGVRSVTDLMSAIYNPTRLPFYGVALVMIGVFLTFVWLAT
jgi:hypothetical protein